eukprot:1803757-Pleurochrysis_carterae.AAC.3
MEFQRIHLVFFIARVAAGSKQPRFRVLEPNVMCDCFARPSELPRVLKAPEKSRLAMKFYALRHQKACQYRACDMIKVVMQRQRMQTGLVATRQGRRWSRIHERFWI